MTEILMDLSAPALVTAIEENSYALFDAFAPLPGAEFERLPTMTRFSTAIVSPMFNGVMRTRLSPEDADAAITESLAFFRGHGRPFVFWWTGPTTSPPDLGRRLVTHGFQPFDLDAPGMAVDLQALNEDVSTSPELDVQVVADERTLGEWAETFCLAYGVPAWAGQSWVQASLAFGLERTPWRLYLGRLGGKPVATAMAIPGGGVAGVTAIATKEYARRQGIGAMMTLAALRDGRALGYRAATLWATEMGTPLYERLGFRRYCTISRYLWRAEG